MSITDASTNVSTTWTEQSTVAFTAGTLSTITDMQTEVESRIKRGTLSASTTPSTTEVQRWLVQAKEKICQMRGFTWTRRYAYATLTSGTWRYGLPPDYGGGEIVLRKVDTSSLDAKEGRLSVWSAVAFDSEYPDPADNDNDEPTIFCIKGNELWANCPSDDSYRIELEYSRTGDDNTTTDFSYIPEPDRWLCCDFATWRSFSSLHQWEAAQIYKQDFFEGQKISQMADGRKRWKSMNYKIPMMAWPKT